MEDEEYEEDDLPLLEPVEYKIKTVDVSLDDHVLDITMSDNARILGLDPSLVTPSSEKCKEVLENGTSCNDFIGIRRYVLCFAWNLIKEGKTNSFRYAMDEAWRYVRKYCPNV
jgi:hypothetical protein